MMRVLMITKKWTNSLGAAIAVAFLITGLATTGCGSSGGNAVDDVLVSQDVLVSDDVKDDILAEDTGLDQQGDICGTCPDGKVCLQGECRCPGAQQDCDGVCTPMGTDENCAECGDACPSGTKCEGFACMGWDMVSVPAGKFMQGCNASSDEQCSENEKPYHEVDVPAFKIDRYEVTVGSYELCVGAGDCEGPPFDRENCVWGATHVRQYPMNCLTWDQAADFCKWAGKRLCSESEWEKAARGTDGRLYPWGDDPATCEYAVMKEGEGLSGCGTGSWLPVGSKPAGASPYGVMDMSGSVTEWVQDDWHGDYEGAPTNGSAWVNDPRESMRPVRGASAWHSNGTYLRSSSRVSNPSDNFAHDMGMRCCVTE